MNRIRKMFMPGKLRSDYADAGDFMRAASVGMIGWYHIWQQSWLNPNLQLGGLRINFYPLVACGYMFVDLMLLLSGFLLMLGYISGRSRDLRGFYSARAARILPSYLLCMAIMLFGFALPGRLYHSGEHMFIDIFSHLTFTHNLFDLSYRSTNLNGALWTLAVEVQFYLIFPLLARAFMRRPGLTWGGMALAGVIGRLCVALFIPENTIYINRLFTMMDVYANGMLAAWLYHRLCTRPQKAWDAWLCTMLALVSAYLICRVINAQYTLRGGDYQRIGQLFWRLPISALGGIFLVCGSRSIYLLRALLSNRIMRFLSGLSFNFYIWHQFLAVKLKQWRIPPYQGENPNQAGLMPWQRHYTLCCFAASLIAALLITYLVEKPCAKRIKRALSAKST